MVLWLAVAAGVLLGSARGGRLGNLGGLPLRLAWLVLPALGIQLWLIFAPPAPPEQGWEPLRLALPLTLVALAVFLVANRRLPGVRLLILGLAANTAVILANGGLMPTNEDALLRAGMEHSVKVAREHPGIRLARSKDVLLPVEQTRLWWLSDTLVSPPLPRPKVMSVGDLLVAVGIVVLISQAMRRPYRSKALHEVWQPASARWWAAHRRHAQPRARPYAWPSPGPYIAMGNEAHSTRGNRSRRGWPHALARRLFGGPGRASSALRRPRELTS